MLYNPHLPAPARADAWSEGFAKGFLGSASTDPGGSVGPDELDAYNEGVLAGLDAAQNGITPDNACVYAPESENPFHTEQAVIEFGGIAIDVVHKAWAGVLAGFVSSVVLLMITASVNTLPPEQVLPRLGQPLIDRIAGYGLDSVELFCGVGADPFAEGCELQLTSLYPTLDQARDAATTLGRSPWFVVSWRTDQSGSFRIVETG